MCDILSVVKSFSSLNRWSVTFLAGPYASMQTFPLTNGVDKGQGYQTAGTPTGISSNF